MSVETEGIGARIDLSLPSGDGMDTLAPFVVGFLGSPEEIISYGEMLNDGCYRTFALGKLRRWIADSGGAVIAADPRISTGVGCDTHELLGFGFLKFVAPADRPVVSKAWRSASFTATALDYDFRLSSSDGGDRWFRCCASPQLDAAGAITCWYGFIEDVDDRKRRALEQARLVDRDHATGLLNRRSFMSAVRLVLAENQEARSRCCLVRVDLDGFKAFNMRNDVEASDALLRETASRLSGVAPDGALLARIGGGQFAAFLSSISDIDVSAFVGSLGDELRASHAGGNSVHTCPANIGVACGIGARVNADILYKNSVLALNQAKTLPSRIAYFESSMRSGLQVRMSEMSMARYLLDRDRVFPFYQPKVDLSSGKVKGFEALLRWQGSNGEIKSPAGILAAMEDPGLSTELDHRMLKRVGSDLGIWDALGVTPGRIAINISASQFAQPDFAAGLLRRIQSAGIAPSRLELEITESVFLNGGTGNVLETMKRLRDAGLTLALDDFGTGYASLIHLKQFPIDVLKIDRSFVAGLVERPNSVIVQTMLDLGERLGLSTVAEGVETVAQAEELKRFGCGLGQGYLYSPAVPADRVPELLR